MVTGFTKMETVAFVEENEYTADGLTNNEYCFKVSASYATGESEPLSQVTATIHSFFRDIFSDTLDQPQVHIRP